MMALGEVGAFLLSIIAAIWVAAALDDELLLVRIVGSIAALFVVAKMALWFVHLGYRPEKDQS